MDRNKLYIKKVQIDEIPWHRLTTTYSRATQFPKYFKTIDAMQNLQEVKNALKEVAINIEHQSTLWHATPFALIFLVRIFKKAVSKMKNDEIGNFVVKELAYLFDVILQSYEDSNEMEHAEQLPLFEDMLKEKYLWSEIYSEEEDELRYEEDEVFPDDLFYSFYYYSYKTIQTCIPMLENLKNK